MPDSTTRATSPSGSRIRHEDERHQEYNGKAFVGYVSMRFMQPTRALLGEQKWPITVAVEVGGLKDVKGSQDLVEYAQQYALNPAIYGYLP